VTRRRTAAALSTIYLAWGSTYLAIRVMVETLPPLVATGARFVLAGALLVAALVSRGGWRRLSVGSRELAAAAIVGSLVLCGGIGLVTVAEQHVASGIAALVIASVPLWILALRAVDAERIPRASALATVAGFTGLALLLAPGEDSVRAAAVATAVGTWYGRTIGSCRQTPTSLPRCNC
jgi:drug/metabolite transporter (DMT)-like permease